MPLQPFTDDFHIKKLCSRFSSREVQFRRKTAVLCFWATSGI